MAAAAALAANVPTTTRPPAAAAATSEEANGRYIVRYHDRDQLASRAGSLRPASGDAIQVLDTEEPLAVLVLSPDEAAAMADDPAVAAIEPDHPLFLTGVQEPTPAWGLDRIDQTSLPGDDRYAYDTTGSGVRIYVVDSGIRADHDDLTGRVAPGFTTVDDGWGTSDCLGHGTHVAATAAGTQFGVAKRATVVPVRIFTGCDKDAKSTTAALVEALDWVRRDIAGRPAVVNLSLGGPGSATVDAAVSRLTDAGIPVVVAAGNEGADACTRSPARVPAAITVGATASDDRRASFSNHGPCLDLFAPGQGIVSAYHTGTRATATMSGTSMATPHVTGAVARLRQTQPCATPAQLASGLAAGASTGVLRDIGVGSPDRLLRALSSVPVPGTSSGYWMLRSDGGLHAFGSATEFAGTAATAAALDSAPCGGLWLLRSDGTVEGRGSAWPFGGIDTGVLPPGERPVAISGLPDGTGYWIFTDRGRAVPRGAARHFGDVSHLRLNGPVIASIATATGRGYYMIASDGGVFAFGDAGFHGSMGGHRLNRPVVGVAPTSDASGYWLIGADGGIFAFNAPFRGSVPGVLSPGQQLNQPVIGGRAYGNGYAMVAADGGVFVFSDSPFLASLGGTRIPAPVVGLTVTR